MNLSEIKYVYLLGIGGIGMSALARYFKANGKIVSGYDRTQTTLTIELVSEGIDVNYSDEMENIPPHISSNQSLSLIIFTPAIPKDSVQYNYLLKSGVNMVKRSVVLGWIAEQSFTIAVAGTHGKTTTSSIITHLLKQADVNCTAFVGGISINYDSNFILGNYDDASNLPKVVVEADEFDRSFLTLHPDIAVITSMDADHLDIYGDKEQLEESYRLFAKQVKHNGLLIHKAGLPIPTSATKNFSYSIEQQADYRGENIRVENNQFVFDLFTPQNSFPEFSLGLPGRHNVENAVAACAVALQSGVETEKIKLALASYRGVHRRFEYHIRNKNLTFIDDYAHHPEELRAAISSVKELYPDKKITGIFQPHLYTRTRDFVDGFAESLSLLDQLFLLDIYPARELPIEGITSKIILDKVTITDKKIVAKENLLAELKASKPEVVMTLGAGDIDALVVPIKKTLDQLL